GRSGLVLDHTGAGAYAGLHLGSLHGKPPFYDYASRRSRRPKVKRGKKGDAFGCRAVTRAQADGRSLRFCHENADTLLAAHATGRTQISQSWEEGAAPLARAYQKLTQTSPALTPVFTFALFFISLVLSLQADLVLPQVTSLPLGFIDSPTSNLQGVTKDK